MLYFIFFKYGYILKYRNNLFLKKSVLMTFSLKASKVLTELYRYYLFDFILSVKKFKDLKI